jgi:hypothetical protein
MLSFDLLEISLHPFFFFTFLSMRLYQSYVHGRKVCELTRFNWGLIFVVFFLNHLFLVFPFNIRLFNNLNRLRSGFFLPFFFVIFS